MKKKGAISLTGYKSDSPDRNNAFNLIPSNQITMHGVNHPVLMIPMGHAGMGNPVLGYPGENYLFPRHEAVLEFPVPQGANMSYERFQKDWQNSEREATNPDNPKNKVTYNQFMDDWAKSEREQLMNPDPNAYQLLKKGGSKKLQRYTSQNVKSSINELMKRNETLFGLPGKHYYRPSFQQGGPNPGDPNVPPPPAAVPEDQYMSAMDEYMAAKAAYEAEQKRVAGLSGTLLQNAQQKDIKNTPTRTDLGWIDQGRYFCNSHTCELMQDSGYTVPNDVMINGKLVKAGSKIPLIPGNIQMQGLAPKMGFVPVSSNELQPGDFVQEKIQQDYDYQGNPYAGGWMPAHSMIYAGTDEQGQKVYYNAPGGARDNYDLTPLHGTEGKEYKLSGWRYVGNTPALEQEMLAKKKAMDQMPIPKMPTRQVTAIPTNHPAELQMPNWSAQFNAERERINASGMSKKKKEEALAAIDAQEQEIQQRYNQQPVTTNSEPMNTNQMKNGGEAFPQQPTAKQFFAQGWIPPGPVGFYMHGGTHLPEAFPQQVPANYFFAGAPWSPEFSHGGMPCMECGGHMQDGGIIYSDLEEMKSGGNWIQKATASIKRRGTEGKCSGKNFGGPGCPPGSKAYNLAKTFRAMAKKQFGGDTQDIDQDDYISQYRNTFMGALKNNTAMNIADQAANQVQQVAMQYGGAPMNDYGFVGNPMMDLYGQKSNYLDQKAKAAGKNFYNATGNALQSLQNNSYMDWSTTPKAQTGTSVQPSSNPFTQEQFFQYMDEYNKRNQSNNQYNTPNNQQQWQYHPSQGGRFFPANYNSGWNWSTNQGGRQYAANPNALMAFNPNNTYLQNFEYRGRLFGQGPRKISMTFRTYTDPQTGQQTQVPVTNNQANTPVVGPQNNPIMMDPKQMNPTVTTPNPDENMVPVENLKPMTGKDMWYNPQMMAYGGYMPKAQFGYNAFGQPDPQFQGPLSPEYVNANTPGFTQQQQQLQQPSGNYVDTTVTGKWKNRMDGESAANWILAGTEGITALLNKRDQRKTDEQMQRMTLADNQFASMPANRIQNQGRYNWTGMSAGMMDPNSMVPVQQPGMNFNMEGQAFSQMGGPVELDEDQINYILANGGSIQYLD